MLAKKRPVNNAVLRTLFSVIGYVIYHDIFPVWPDSLRRHDKKKFFMNVFFFFVLLEHKRRTGEGNIREEYYRGLLIFCFAFELFQPRTPLLKSKAAPSFSNNSLAGDIKYIHVQRTKETERCEK